MQVVQIRPVEDEVDTSTAVSTRGGTEDDNSEDNEIVREEVSKPGEQGEEGDDLKA